MFRLALTKGRIEDKAVKLLSAAGYDTSDITNKGRRLLLRSGDELEVVLAKAADVITYVEHGVCDAGIVGKDTIMENGGSFYEVLDMGFGRCRFALAGRNPETFFSGYAHKVVATKYPNVAKEYFKSKGLDVQIVKIEGSVELAPVLGLSDAIVDIVETGATLKENGLEIIDSIADISARLIINTASLKMKKNEIDTFVKRMKEAIGEGNA